MDRRRLDALPGEAAGETVRPALGPGEDEDPIDLDVFEQREQEAELARPFHEVDRLGHRLVEETTRELTDLAGLRGREQQGLALTRKRGGDAADVGDEAHVEHAIGLVEDEHLHLGEVHHAVAHQVEEPPGRRHQHVHAAAQRLHLGALADAPEDDLAAHAAPRRVAAEALGDLGGQLAGGSQDQGADRPAAVVGLDAQQLVEDGEREGRGLAGAGLGAGEQVAGLQRVGNGPSLDGSRLGVAELLEHGDQLGVELEALETARGGTRAGLLFHGRGGQMDSCHRRGRRGRTAACGLGRASRWGRRVSRTSPVLTRAASKEHRADLQTETRLGRKGGQGLFVGWSESNGSRQNAPGA